MQVKIQYFLYKSSNDFTFIIYGMSLGWIQITITPLTTQRLPKLAKTETDSKGK